MVNHVNLVFSGRQVDGGSKADVDWVITIFFKILDIKWKV